MSIGNQIRATRIARGMNMTSLANILGVSTSAVSNWEGGKMTPRPHMQAKIAQALGFSLGAGTSQSNGNSTSYSEAEARAKADFAAVLNVPPTRVKIAVTVE